MQNKISSLLELLLFPTIKVVIVAHDIRSAYNIGAILRTADGAGQTGVILSGYSPTPENPKVAKTALGADFQVPWFQITSLEELKDLPDVLHVGLELSPKAMDLFTWKPPENKKIVLYIGNEVTGLPLELMLDLETFVQIPMNGSKKSLNVAEATSIAIYELLRKTL